MQLYCPTCREMNDWGSETCTHCGAPLRGPEGETYVEKLIWALHHRDASTALRAATILGDLRAREATGALEEVLSEPETDPYLGAAAARGLGAIGDEGSLGVLVEALERGPLPVRLAAVEALEDMGPREEAVRALQQASRDGSLSVSEASKKVMDRWSRLA